MNKSYPLVLLLGILFFSACTNRNLRSTKNSDQLDLMNLLTTMTGEFSSAAQAKADTLFYDINLVMHPIWENDKSAKWLYVEQAVTSRMDKPYRQRVYRLSKQKDGSIESSVFELPDPARFIQGWKEPDKFKRINADSLIVRPGCAVYLKKGEDNCYSGSTKERECLSDFRGATYATSKVSICADQVISWDQGWDGDDVQVWGAETRGYIFKRKKALK